VLRTKCVSGQRSPLGRWPSPDQSGAEADEQAGEQAQGHHAAGLDDMQPGRAHAERGGLRVCLRLDVGRKPLERRDGVLLVGLELPAERSAPGAFCSAGLRHGIEPALGQFGCMDRQKVRLR
jgi:hypothetical protein